MRKDTGNTASEEAARSTMKLIKTGEEIMSDAAIEATEKMATMLDKVSTPGGKAEALKHHGIYMGIGTKFMQMVVPHAKDMAEELKEIGSSDSEARVLTGLWLAKIFMEVQKGIEKYEQEK